MTGCYSGKEVIVMQAILNLQKLETPLGEANFFGDSCSSSCTCCCNDTTE